VQRLSIADGGEIELPLPGFDLKMEDKDKKPNS